MRRSLVLIAAGAACALASTAGTASADRPICPDDMTPLPAVFVNNGTQKDRNTNGVVCAKPTTCLVVQGNDCKGGPDDDTFGVPLLGADGKWYYVTDDL